MIAHCTIKRAMERGRRTLCAAAVFALVGCAGQGLTAFGTVLEVQPEPVPEQADVLLEAQKLKSQRRWQRVIDLLEGVEGPQASQLSVQSALHEARQQIHQSESARRQGLVWLAEKHLDAAVASLDKALEIWPYNSAPQTALANARAQRNEAERWLKQARQWAAESRWDEALVATGTAGEIDPDHPQSRGLTRMLNEQACAHWVHEGQRLVDAGEVEQARPALRRALRYQPHGLAAARGLAAAEEQLGLTAAAQGLWGRALLHHLMAVQYGGAEQYQHRQDAAGRAILDRNPVQLNISVRDEANQGSAETSWLDSMLRAHLIEQKPPFIHFAATADPPIAPTHVAAITLIALDVQNVLAASERRTYAHTEYHLVSNPLVPVLRGRLHAATHSLNHLRRHEKHERCRHCGGAGTVRCSSCDGKGTRTCSACRGGHAAAVKHKRIKCSTCSGRGGRSKRCGHCGGSGKGARPSRTETVQEHVETRSCSSCAGRGSMTKRCGRCGGSGKSAAGKKKGRKREQRACARCGGSGQVTNRCGRCGGGGKTKHRSRRKVIRRHAKPSPCSHCRGRGTRHETCGTCRGARTVAVRGHAGRCGHCGGRGQSDCDRCGRRGHLSCDQCRGTGRHDSGRSTKLNDAQHEVQHIQHRLARTPTVVRHPHDTYWSYTVQRHRKIGRVKVRLSLHDAAGKELVTPETIKGGVVHEDEAVDRPNPAIGLAEDPLTLPSDERMIEQVLDGAARNITLKLLQHVTQAHADALRDEARRLEQQGERAGAVEAKVAAALVLEGIDPAGTQRTLRRLARQ